MAQQTIGLGSVANDGTGDTLRAGGTKINANFTELYAAAAASQPLDADLTALAAISGVQGDIIYRNATQWVRLGAGSSGQLLQSGGAGANPAWATPSASGAGGVWTLHQAVTTTAAQTSQAFTGLAGATDIMILARNLAQSVSGVAIAHVSTDNGSTWFTTSGDYTFFTTDSGLEGNTTGLGLFLTNSTAARGGLITISGCNVTGAPRVCECRTQQSTMCRFFVADNSNDIDAVRITPNAGSWSAGGLLYCYKR